MHAEEGVIKLLFSRIMCMYIEHRKLRMSIQMTVYHSN